MKVKTQVGGCTSIGLVRKNQEDAAMIYGLPFGGYFLAQSDGMGGCPAGEVASKIAVQDTLRAMLSESGTIQDRLVKGVYAAHVETYLWGKNHPRDRGLGCTLDAAVVRRNKLYLSHTGDSRVYLFRDGVLTRLTRDHSYIGSYTDENGERREREYIEHCIGHSPLHFDSKVVDLVAGDIVMLCSDGVHGLLSDYDIETIMLVSDKSMKGLAEDIVEAALRAGGWDNATVVLAQV